MPIQALDLYLLATFYFVHEENYALAVCCFVLMVVSAIMPHLGISR